MPIKQYENSDLQFVRSSKVLKIGKGVLRMHYLNEDYTTKVQRFLGFDLIPNPNEA
jgi:hypothetical protein